MNNTSILPHGTHHFVKNLIKILKLCVILPTLEYKQFKTLNINFKYEK